jgi:hypothetical protein
MIHYLHLREKNGGPARLWETFRSKKSPFNYGQLMRSFGEAGAILVDKTTFRRLGQRYSCEAPRDIEIKGKGVTTTYRLSAKL